MLLNPLERPPGGVLKCVCRGYHAVLGSAVLRRRTEYVRELLQEGQVCVGADVRANFVCVHNGELVATVFSNEWEPWQVIIHDPTGASILKHENFQDPQAAMSRAEEILDGTSVHGNLHRLMPAGFANTFTQ